jgi:FdhE protein
LQRILEPGQIESIDHTAIPRFRLPVRSGVFVDRANRLRQLAANAVPGIPVDPALSGYLSLMAALADAQQSVLMHLTDSDVGPLDPEGIAQAQAHSMPVVPASGPRAANWYLVFERLLDKLEQTVEGGPMAAAPALVATLRRLRGLQAPVGSDATTSKSPLDAAADALLADRAAPDAAAAPFLYAALQVWWTDRASRLRDSDIPYVEHAGLCPVCGTHPVASVVRIGAASQGYRYLQCGLCATEFHMVRVKCTTCASTAKIAYHGIVETDAPDEEVDAGAPGGKRIASDPSKFAKAESCDHCHTYRKIFYQEHDYSTEPLADDLASLSLDMLMTEAGYDRASGNPLLWLDEQAT